MVACLENESAQLLLLLATAAFLLSTAADRHLIIIIIASNSRASAEECDPHFPRTQKTHTHCTNDCTKQKTKRMRLGTNYQGWWRRPSRFRAGALWGHLPTLITQTYTKTVNGTRTDQRERVLNGKTTCTICLLLYKERRKERERKIIAIFQQTKWPKRSLYCVANECILQPSIPLFDHLSVFQQT